MKNKTGLWIIAAFVIMIFCFAVANATSTLGRIDGQIKMQNDVIDFVSNAGEGTFTLDAEKITVDTLVVDSVFTFDGDVAVDSIYSGSNITAVGTISAEQLTSTDDATITDDLTVGGITQSEHLYSTDDGVIADSLYVGDDLVVADSIYVGGNIVGADTLFITNMVQAEQLTSTDDATITDDLSIGGETTLSGGIIFNVTTVEDSAYTVLVSDYIIDISHTDTDTVDVTIPTALISAGKAFQIWDTEFNADTNYITINTEGAETINEAVADTISVAGGKRLIWSDGTNWFSRE